MSFFYLKFEIKLLYVTLNGLPMGDFPFVSMSTRKLDPMGLYPL
jgi:hypothetical protein